MDFLAELITEFICGIFESIMDDKKVSLIVRISLYSVLFLAVLAFVAFGLVAVIKGGNYIGIALISAISVFLIAIWIHAIRAFIREDRKKHK